MQTSYANETSSSILRHLMKSKIKLQSRSTSKLKPQLGPPIEQRWRREDTAFLVELVRDISNELSLKILSEKNVTNLRLLSGAEQCTHFFVCQSKQVLAAFRLDEDGGDEMSPKNIGAEIPFDATLLGLVARSGD